MIRSSGLARIERRAVRLPLPGLNPPRPDNPYRQIPRPRRQPLQVRRPSQRSPASPRRADVTDAGPRLALAAEQVVPAVAQVAEQVVLAGAAEQVAAADLAVEVVRVGLEVPGDLVVVDPAVAVLTPP